MSSDARSHPRFNHIALSVPAELLGESGRADLLAFYSEVFGWTEMPTLTRDRELFVLRAHSNEQFVFLAAADDPMRCSGDEHFGMSVPSVDDFEAVYARARGYRERDPRVDLVERQVEDFEVLQLHNFYVGYLLPMRVEVQCYAWREGFGDQSGRHG